MGSPPLFFCSIRPARSGLLRRCSKRLFNVYVFTSFLLWHWGFHNPSVFTSSPTRVIAHWNSMNRIPRNPKWLLEFLGIPSGNSRRNNSFGIFPGSYTASAQLSQFPYFFFGPIPGEFTGFTGNCKSQVPVNSPGNIFWKSLTEWSF